MPAPTECSCVRASRTNIVSKISWIFVDGGNIGLIKRCESYLLQLWPFNGGLGLRGFTWVFYRPRPTSLTLTELSLLNTLVARKLNSSIYSDT